MLHRVRRLDGLGVPSPIIPRDPTTFVKERSSRKADQVVSSSYIYQEIVTREADLDEDSSVCQSEIKK